MTQQDNQSKQIQIKATDEKMKGEYANMMQVMHTQEEFVLDFLNMFPADGYAQRPHHREPEPYEAHGRHAGRQSQEIRVPLRRSLRR